MDGFNFKIAIDHVFSRQNICVCADSIQLLYSEVLYFILL